MMTNNHAIDYFSINNEQKSNPGETAIEKPCKAPQVVAYTFNVINQ